MIRRGRPRSGADAGFLLTETLATFTISAFVLLGLVSASSVLLHAVDRSATQVEDVDALGRTLSAIGRDLSDLSRARWNGLEPQPFVFEGGPNSLFFAHRAIGREGEGETQVVAMREIVGAAGPQLVRSDALLSPLATAFADLRYGPARPLATGPARLRFYYVMAPGNGKPEQPRVRSWPSGDTLPSAVIVEAVDRTSGRLIASARMPIRANADIGCLPGGGGAASVAAPGVPAPAFDGSQEVSPFLQGANFKGAEGAKDSGFCGRADKDEGKPSAAGNGLPIGGPSPQAPL